MVQYRILLTTTCFLVIIVSRENKPWHKKKSVAYRTFETRGEPKQSFLIVCEGEKTEPNYFKSFRVKSASIEILGIGCNTISLVDETSKKVKKYKKEGFSFDQVWCVFDRDDFAATFNDAIFKARRLGFKVAYSNEAFELWYLLHYTYFDAQIGRADYIVKLDKLLGRKYKKNSNEMYELLLPNQEEAIKRSKKLLGNFDLKNPNNEAPSTMVHLLVEELNKYN